MRFHHKSKTKILHRPKLHKTIFVAAILLAFVTTAQGFIKPAAADQYDEKIKALQAQIDNFDSRAKDLAAQADTLNNKISELQNEQAQLQAQINLSNAKHDELVQQIADNEAKLKEQSSALGKTLADIYYGQQTTTLDILLNSNSISDYVDKQTRQNSMKDQLTKSVTAIDNLKKQLESEKAEVERLQQQQATQKSQLADSQQQQQSLLDSTKGQEAAYQSMIQTNNSQIEQLRAQQRAANAAKQGQYGGQITVSGTCGGGYPASSSWTDSAGRAHKWGCNYAQDNDYDPFGMFNRECVSYAAWKVYSTYGYMPYWGGRGNAKNWLSNAAAAGIPTSKTPKVGTVGVMTGGSYGHVVWVEKVDGSRVYVSQYNWDMAGHYSEMWISASAFDGYIYFGDK